ncbi:Acetylserotonin methytransferase-like protein [Madurella fahalii]|uniref:Acetylserotonin methytransferase-like protein n=1 Tax=Madurella fahalii TaxID=1157608 RepID=A0ABQ0FZW0_9PEZI
MSAPHAAGGFSLFPNTSNTPRPPSRSQSTRPRAATPQGRPSLSAEATSPRPGGHASVRRNSSATREGKQRAVSNNPWQHALDARPQQFYADSTVGPSTAAAPAATADPVIETTTSQPVTDVPQRCETAFSEAQTLVRSPSQRSRNSIAKPPLAYAPAGPSSSVPPGTAIGEPPALRSIFPRYNHELPLDRQEYYPTQASPTHIPQAAISRPLYSPRSAAAGASGGPRSPAYGAQVVSPAPTANSSSRWPGHRHHEPAVIPPVSTTEELRGLWKVTNGWKASSLEAHNYCLKMTAAPDAPMYTLSSSTSQPFYCLRVDPTSASALVSLSRYDPNKPFKANTAIATSNTPSNPGNSSPSPRASSSSSRRSEHVTQLHNVAHSPSTTSAKHQKYWQEVLVTTLEQNPLRRRHPTSSSNNNNANADANENDGLVAHLWPAAAARLAADRANDAATVALAQQESARLVWDADSGNHFLVHPALAVPFCVTIERSPAYSRTEYTLEHLESPAHLARLTRDGTGAGWLEVDTGIASKVDAVYLVDVAVAALVLVAHSDEGFVGGVEVFEPPPVVFGGPNGSVLGGGGGGGGAGGAGGEDGGRTSRGSRRLVGAVAAVAGAGSRRESRREEKERRKEMKRGKSGASVKKRMEHFEMDLESQSSTFGKASGQDKDKDKIPGVARALIGLLTVTFKCFVWCATLAFKALMAILSGLARCCGLGKL